MRTELSWTHYRTLLRLENEAARQWYLQESIDQSWSARALERQISTLYYECLLSSRDKAPVRAEAQQHTQVLHGEPRTTCATPMCWTFSTCR